MALAVPTRARDDGAWIVPVGAQFIAPGSPPLAATFPWRRAIRVSRNAGDVAAYGGDPVAINGAPTGTRRDESRAIIAAPFDAPRMVFVGAQFIAPGSPPLAATFPWRRAIRVSRNAGDVAAYGGDPVAINGAPTGTRRDESRAIIAAPFDAPRMVFVGAQFIAPGSPPLAATRAIHHAYQRGRAIYQLFMMSCSILWISTSAKPASRSICTASSSPHTVPSPSPPWERETVIQCRHEIV